MTTDYKSQFGILELLAPLIEAWWLLLLVPAISGGAAYYVSGTHAGQYETQVIVDVPFEKSSELTLPIAVNTPYASASAAPGRVPNTTAISIRAPSPETVQSAAESLSAYVESTFDPFRAERGSWIAKTKVHDEAIAYIRGAMEQIEPPAPATGQGENPEALSAYATAVAQLAHELARQETAKIDMTSKLEALPSATILSAIQSAQPVPQNRTATAAFAVLASFLLMVFLIAARESLMNAVRMHPNSPGLRRIRNVLPKWASR